MRARAVAAATLVLIAANGTPGQAVSPKQLAQPKNVVAAAVSTTSISVAFSPVTDAASYTVYIYGAKGQTRTVHEHAESGTVYDELSVCTDYRVSVQAISSAGAKLDSVQSGKMPVTTLCNAAYIPTFATPVPTADGYTVQVTNFNSAYTWNATVSTGAASIDGIGKVFVTGVATGQSATLTVTTARATYYPGTASISAVAGLPISHWIGAGDFTIEFWVKPTMNYSGAGRQELVALTNSAISDRLDITYEGNAWNIYTGSSIPALFGDFFLMSVGAPAPTSGVWTHVALTRQSGTVRLYVAGSRIGSDASGAGDLSGLNRLQLGADVNVPSCHCNFATGLLSNVRVVDGTALYTGSTYTVPVSKLTAIAGTTFLLTPLLGDATLNSVTVTGTNYYRQDITAGSPPVVGPLEAYTWASGWTATAVLTSTDTPV